MAAESRRKREMSFAIILDIWLSFNGVVRQGEMLVSIMKVLLW